MKIEVDIDLVIETISGLKAYGGTATENTVKRLKQSILDAVGYQSNYRVDPDDSIFDEQ